MVKNYLYLYHMVTEKDDDIYTSIPQNVLDEGLNRKTVTRWYTNGGTLFQELTDHFKPINSPKWINLTLHSVQN